MKHFLPEQVSPRLNFFAAVGVPSILTQTNSNTRERRRLVSDQRHTFASNQHLNAKELSQNKTVGIRFPLVRDQTGAFGISTSFQSAVIGLSIFFRRRGQLLFLNGDIYLPMINTKTS